MPKVCIVCTSADKMGEKPTGLWLEEIASPYLMMKEKGYEIDVVSVKGGAVPVDEGSLGAGFYTDYAKKFKEEDADAWAALQNTAVLDVDKLASYDAVYFPGGHGCCVDFVKTGEEECIITKAVEMVFASEKLLAFCCHGPIALCQAKKPDGTPLVAGKKVTGFSDSEEAAVGLTDKVPMLIEKTFREQGADFQKAADWTPCVVKDGNLITGQNPQSSEGVAKLIMETLG